MADINGVTLGIVTDVMDPLGKGRVRVRLPILTGNDSLWALTCIPFGSTVAARPKVSDTVVVAFEHGSFDRPIVLGKVSN